MGKLILNQNSFNLNKFNTVEITVPTNMQKIRVINAYIKLEVSSVNNNERFEVKYLGSGENDGWGNVDKFMAKSNDVITINVSDELQDIFMKGKIFFKIKFIGENGGNIIFSNSSENKLYLEYISIDEYNENSVNKNLKLGDVVEIGINLPTGKLNYTVEIMPLDENVLPLSLGLNYYQDRNSSIGCVGFGDYFGLNVNQFLIKNKSLNNVNVKFNSENSNGLVFTYIDSNGKEQSIEEKYYYEEKKSTGEIVKHFIDSNSVQVNMAGELVFIDNGVSKKIKTVLKAPSGLKLVSSIEDIKGSHLVDFEPKEFVEVKNQLEAVDNSIVKLNQAIKQYKNQLILIALQKNYGFYELKDGVENNCSSISDLENIVTVNLGEEVKNLVKDQCGDIFNKWHEISPENLGGSVKNISILGTKLNANSLTQDLKDSMIDLQKYKNLKTKLEYKKTQYEMQMPVHYLYSENGEVLGFGKTTNEDVYRLVLIADSYENSILFRYESLTSNKLLSITNSVGNMIVFEYDGEHVKQIIDDKERKTEFEYVGEELRIIKLSNGEKIIMNYHSPISETIFKSNLTGVLLENENGLEINYYENTSKVKSFMPFSFIEKFEDGKVVYKEGYDPENYKNVSASESSNIFNNLEKFYICKNSFKINYNNFRSATIIDGNNKSYTYLFDSKGNVRTYYENKISDDNVLDVLKVYDYSYVFGKCTRKVVALPYSENYLSDVCSNGTFSMEATYFGMDYLSDEVFAYNYVPTCGNVHEKLESECISDLSFDISKSMIKKINEENGCGHKVYIANMWAKADSAYVADYDEIDIEDKLQLEKNGQLRGFDLNVVVEYIDGECERFKQNFDWRNTEWQYCSLPVVLKDKQVERIKVNFNYQNNVGNVEYKDPTFVLGDFEEQNFDEFGRVVKSVRGHSKFITEYVYDGESSRVLKEIQINKKCESEKYVSLYQYNKNGVLWRTISHNGVVTDNVLNENGEIIKTLTYHKDEPTVKFVQENILDEKGKETCSVNEFGEKISTFEFDEVTGKIISEIDGDGSTNFGYNEKGELIETSASSNGVLNTNIKGYVFGNLTSLKHNGFETNFDYDNENRITKVKIAGKEYLKKLYSENEETTILASGEIYRTEFNDDGNILAVFYKKSEIDEEICLKKNIFDITGNVAMEKDLVNDVERKIVKNNFGNVKEIIGTQHGKSVNIINSLNDEHNKVTATELSIDGKQIDYLYGYSNDIDDKLESIILPNGKKQKVTYDKLGRVKEVSIESMIKQYSYLTKNGQTSNLVSKVKYGTNGITDETMQYVYDKNGNITEIRKNNTLVVRYTYDTLSRLVREDNKELGQTVTYSYDEGGNIVCKQEYVFTLSNNLDFETGTSIDYSYAVTGWKDQLMCFNNEIFKYDNLGNPTIYRGKNLEWEQGRRLKRFEGVEYTYNADGIRISKTVDGTTTKFYLDGTKILLQTDEINTMLFEYGVDGVVGFELNNQHYVYKKNLQNDVIGIIDNAGNEIVRYKYDAWGNCYTETNEQNLDLFKLNPFRYRSYYYDEETKLYYLNSRYYDPETGRFINADDVGVLSTTKDVLNGLNLYVYCLNNPINEVDESGYFGLFSLLGIFIATIAFGVANTVIQVVSDVFNYSVTGKWNSSWEDYLGAFFGGVTGGIAFCFSYNLELTFGIMSAFETFSTNLLTNLSGKTNTNFLIILGESFLSFGIGFGMGKLFGGTKVLGITKGLNNYFAVFKSGLKKLANGTAKKMSIKVMMKGIVAIMTLKSNGSIATGIFTGIYEWIKYFINGSKENLGYV